MSHAAWLQQAESDLEASRVLSAARHHSQAVWFAAQAVEKAHKAILAALGLRYEERHYKHLGHNTAEIARLLPEALHEPPDPQIAEMVSTLESSAGSSRYPAPAQTTGAGVARVVAPAARIVASRLEIENAMHLLDWCRERIARAVRAARVMKPSP